MDEAIARYPKEHRRSAAMPLLHLWQEHFGFISDEPSMDRGETWSAADQHPRAGYVLSNVSPEARGKNAYPGLPHTQLRHGW